MNGFLDAVIEQKERDLSAKKRLAPVGSLSRDVPSTGAADFLSAVRGGGVIAEVKRRSPSVDSYLQCGAPEDLALTYEANGACAISIVTDERNFGTSLADLKKIKRAVSLPVLAKDFVIDSYQVREIWAAGADAVLLIAGILSADRLISLLSLCGELGMSALVECRDEKNIDKAAFAGAPVIGINNRDLATLEVSLERTMRLAQLIPSGFARVCESGIRNRGDIEKLHGYGMRTFLVGGALLDSEDPGAELRALSGLDGETRRPRIKVCGITSAEDAVLCDGLGADYLGLIFAESPRRIDSGRGGEIRRTVPGAKLVGVFVNADQETVVKTAQSCGLDMLQLHGVEPPELVASLAGRLGLPIIKSFSAGSERSRGDFGEYKRTDYFLFDYEKGLAVSERRSRELWDEAAAAVSAGRRVFLAGGLTPGNVGAAAKRVRPYCVDVCSGVESAPGVKDAWAVRRFISEVSN